MRKLLSRLLPLTLSAALLVQPALAAGRPSAPEDWTSPFSDVREKDWFYPFVAVLNHQNVISGYPDGHFGPNEEATSGAALLMVLRAAGLGVMDPQEGTHWASAYADYAVERGWLTQKEAAALDGSISRLLVSKLTAQALGLAPSANPSPFADSVDGYAVALYEKGILSGSPEGDKLLFKPDASLTRAELSVIVWQVQEYASHIHFAGKDLDILNVPVNPYAAESFVLQDGRMTYTGEDFRALQGIDVSAHQGDIDWEQVAGDGIEFAMLRAGGRYYGLNSGNVFEDAQFRKNLRGALDAGLQVGVYFFSQATSVEEAEEEALFLLERIGGQPISGPVVFDWETISNGPARTDGVDGQTLNAMANAFCALVEGAGFSPMVYFNRDLAYLYYDLEEIVRYPFWLAQYSTTPDFYYQFQMWQYSDKGQVAGVDGNADLNLWLLPQ